MMPPHRYWGRLREPGMPAGLWGDSSLGAGGDMNVEVEGTQASRGSGRSP